MTPEELAYKLIYEDFLEEYLAPNVPADDAIEMIAAAIRLAIEEERRGCLAIAFKAQDKVWQNGCGKPLSCGVSEIVDAIRKRGELSDSGANVITADATQDIAIHPGAIRPSGETDDV